MLQKARKDGHLRVPRLRIHYRTTHVKTTLISTDGMLNGRVASSSGCLVIILRRFFQRWKGLLRWRTGGPIHSYTEGVGGGCEFVDAGRSRSSPTCWRWRNATWFQATTLAKLLLDADFVSFLLLQMNNHKETHAFRWRSESANQFSLLLEDK